MMPSGGGGGGTRMLNGGSRTHMHSHHTLDRHGGGLGDAEFEPSCVVRTPSGNVYIPSDIPKGTLDYKSNSSCSSPSKMDIQKNHERCSLGFGPPVPVLPVRNNLRNRPGSTHHFPPPRFQFQKSFASRCTWKCTAIVFIILSLVLTAALTYISIANILHWSYNKMPCSVLVEEETSETLVKPLLETSAMGGNRNTSARLRPSSSLASVTPGGGGGGGSGGGGGGGRRRRSVDGHDQVVEEGDAPSELHVDSIVDVVLSMHDAPLNSARNGEDVPLKPPTQVLDVKLGSAVPLEPSNVAVDVGSTGVEPLKPSNVVEADESTGVEPLKPSNVVLDVGSTGPEPLEPSNVALDVESTGVEPLEPSNVALDVESTGVEPLEPSNVVATDDSTGVEPLEHSNVALDVESTGVEPLEPSNVALDVESTGVEPLEPSNLAADNESTGVEPSEPLLTDLDVGSSSEEHVELPKAVPNVGSSSMTPLELSNSIPKAGSDSSLPLNPSSAVLDVESESFLPLEPAVLDYESSNGVPLQPVSSAVDIESSSVVPSNTIPVIESSSVVHLRPSSVVLRGEFSYNVSLSPDSLPSQSFQLPVADTNGTEEYSDILLMPSFEPLTVPTPAIYSDQLLSTLDAKNDALSTNNNFTPALDVNPPNNVNTLTAYSHTSRLKDNIQTQGTSGSFDSDSHITDVGINAETEHESESSNQVRDSNHVASRKQSIVSTNTDQEASDVLLNRMDEFSAESSTFGVDEDPLNEIDMNGGGKVVRRPRDFHGVRRLDRFAHPMAFRGSRFEKVSEIVQSPQAAGLVVKVEEPKQSEEDNRFDWQKQKNPAFYSYGSVGDESEISEGDDKVEIKLKDGKVMGFRETNLDYTPENLKRFMSYMNQQSQVERVFINDVTTKPTQGTTEGVEEFLTSTEGQELEAGTEDIFVHDQVFTNTTSFPVLNTNENSLPHSNDNKHVSDITNPGVPTTQNNNNNGNIIQLTLPEDTNHLAKRVFVNVTIGSENGNGDDGKQQPLYVLSIAVPSFSNEVNAKNGAIEATLDERKSSPPSGVTTTSVPDVNLTSVSSKKFSKVGDETTTVTPMVPGFRLWGSECQCSCPCLQETNDANEGSLKSGDDLVGNLSSGIQNDADSFAGNSTEETEDTSSNSNEYYQDAEGTQYLQLVYSPIENSTETASNSTDFDEDTTSNTTTMYDNVNSSDSTTSDDDLLVDYNIDVVTDPVTVADLVTVTDLPSTTIVPNVDFDGSFEEGGINVTSSTSVPDQDGTDFVDSTTAFEMAETSTAVELDGDLEVPVEVTVPEPVPTGCPVVTTTSPAPPPPVLILEGAKTFPARSFPPDGTTFSQIVLGQKLTNEIAPYGYWNMQFYQSEAAYVKFDYNIPRGASIAVYGRRNALPTHTQYHILEVLSGFKARTARASHSSVKKEVTHYLEPGHWFLSLYNDDGDPQEITFVAAVSEDMTQNCPSGCSGKGSCLMGHCQCNAGFGGEDCSESVCPVLCSQKGEYINGECHCNPGWKGKECSMRHDECEVPDCNGHGHCANGKCACARGYKGKFCEEVDCPHPTCTGHGVCADGGVCICKKGWRGADCAETDQDALQCLPDCSGHGVFDLESQTCQCEPLWSGDDCSRELCDLDCGPHGHCVADSCVCNEGWGGEYCNLKLCDARCNEHGQCKNGTCLCVTGWNGKHCTLEGCPAGCSGHGQCRVNLDSLWECRCSDGWDGRDCSVLLEASCSDGRDNDKDGLVDCEDPECCSNHLCRSSQLCVTSPKPIDILLRKQPPAITASFFERMKFLIEEGSLQNYARQENFNESRSAVVRGRVVTSMGMGLVGVRVSTSIVQEGFTLTREDGWFDLLVNGGGAVTLQFGRTPYRPQNYIVNVPWNEVVIIDTVEMYLNDDKPASVGPHACRAHDYDLMKPVVLATWKHGFQGSCPDKSAILAESQVVQESFQIPGTGLNLVYHSSRATGYLSTIQLQLTPETIPPTLKLIHLTITIEGILFDKIFEADPGIKFTYSWNRLNVYRQRVYGITTALVKVGFEYTDCKDIIYDVQTTKLSGHDMSISEVGGWNLDIHHRYNFHEGILQKGDGSNLYLKQKPRIIKTTLGDGHQRPLDCGSECQGGGEASKGAVGAPQGAGAKGGRLLAPVALAAAPDGSLYVGDFNLVRRIMVDGTVRTVVTLNVTRVAYRYHIALSPLDGTLYISDPESHQILRVRNANDFSDPEHNWESAVGSGERCLPGDEAHCGDGALARDAKLAYPKGVAVSGDNVLYFADGTNIRMVDRDGIVTTVIGNHMHKSHWLPIPCEGTLNIEEVHLRWPTDLAINPLDNSLHIVDDHMILQLTPDGRVKVVAGRPLHCPSRGHDSELATRATLVMPQSIAFAPTGDLFVAESDSQRINRVRVIGTDGKISHYAGAESKCNCLDRGCDCFEQDHFLAFTSKFNTISSVAVSPDGILHIADQANYRIRSVVASIPEARNTPAEAYQREYEVYSPDTQEVYVFNRFGQHISTRNILTGETSYLFTYNVNTSNGKLSTVTDASGNKVFLRRDYASQVNSIENTKGQKCLIRMSRMKLLSELSTPDNYNVTLDYYGPTGLLRSKLDSTGRSYVYNYDEFGRLTSAVTPTGKVVRLAFDLSVKGAMVKVTLDDRQPISMLIKGSTVVTKSGESQQSTMIGTDGSVSTTSPWGHVVSTDTIPYSILSDVDPILGESYPVPAKQRVEIGGEPANRFEWRYFMRKPNGQAKFRPQPGGVVQVGRKLRVNGENLLTLEYDRETGTVAVFMDDRVELLNVTYDRTARPVKWGPRNGIFAGVELEYDRFSRLSKWRWGDLTESYGYDRSGRLAEIWYADGTSTLYTFKDLFSTLPLKVTTPRGSDYLLQYDDAGALQSLTTPRGHIHAFCLQTSLGFFKYQYYSPISRHPFELRYNDDGQILAKLYPHQSGRVAYVYDQSGKLDTVLAGLSSIHYTYQESTSLVKNIDIIDPSFELKHEFKYHVGLLKDEKLKFGSKSGLHNTHYRYQFDGNARISGIDVDIDGKQLPQLRVKYSQNLGMLEGMSDLRVYRNTFNRSVMQDAGNEYFTITDYDQHARVKAVLINIKSFDVFRMDLEYNSRGRICATKLVIGRTSSQQKMAYSADGHILEVTGTNEWKYTYDENGNAISVTEQGQKLTLGYDAGDRVVQVGDVELNGYDARGFVVRRGETKLRYNERGQLSHATERDRFTAWYRYDDRGRLLAMQDAQGNTTQLLYADPHNPDHVTHLHYPKTGRTFRYLYGEKGWLVAVETSEQRFYVASDQNGSPLSLFDTNGNIIKEIKRTPFGRIIRDSNPDFLLPVDYQGGIPDPLTGLLYLNKRWYDPSVGQWMTPDWERLANQLTAPTDVFIYRFQNNDPINPVRAQTVNYMTDLHSWLQLYGYNLNNMLGSLYTRSIVYQPSAKISSPQLAPDFGVMSGLQCIVSKVTGNFGSLGFVAEPLLKMEARTRNLLPRVAYRRAVFGEGLLISRSAGRALVSVVEGVNSVVQDVVTSVFNNSHFLDLHFTQHDQDLFYFVKDNALKLRDDLEELRRLGGMFNVSTHETTDGRELRLQSSDAVVSLRYGADPMQDRHRLLKHAHKRAVERAWEIEKALVASGLSGRGEWTEEEREELILRGRVDGYEGSDIHSVQRYPQLADDPGNVAFRKDARKKRKRRTHRHEETT